MNAFLRSHPLTPSLPSNIPWLFFTSLRPPPPPQSQRLEQATSLQNTGKVEHAYTSDATLSSGILYYGISHESLVFSWYTQKLW